MTVALVLLPSPRCPPSSLLPSAPAPEVHMGAQRAWESPARVFWCKQTEKRNGRESRFNPRACKGVGVSF